MTEVQGDDDTIPRGAHKNSGSLNTPEKEEYSGSASEEKSRGDGKGLLNPAAPEVYSQNTANFAHMLANEPGEQLSPVQIRIPGVKKGLGFLDQRPSQKSLSVASPMHRGMKINLVDVRNTKEVLHEQNSKSGITALRKSQQLQSVSDQSNEDVENIIDDLTHKGSGRSRASASSMVAEHRLQLNRVVERALESDYSPNSLRLLLFTNKFFFVIQIAAFGSLYYAPHNCRSATLYNDDHTIQIKYFRAHLLRESQEHAEAIAANQHLVISHRFC
jgi:hypothetical protein